MTDAQPNPVSLNEAIDGLTFLPDRTPTTTGAESAAAFARLAEYRDGAVFVGHWAGTSEWERHRVGDELVMIVDGSTTMFFLTEAGEESATLGAGDLVVVPQGTWHRFETPAFVKVMSVTPQPTDHTADRPT